MRILLVHNRYRPVAPSGEDRVVDQESAELAARGHAVDLFERRSADIATWSLARRATVPARVVWSEDSRRDLARRLVSFAPDVVHVHNTFPLISSSVLYACRDAGVPVVATLHNYRLGCAPGEALRDGAVCHDCIGGSPLPALRHGCYRGSRLATAPVVAAGILHARAWRTLVSAYLVNTAAQLEVLAPVGLPPERCFVKPHFVPPPPPGPPAVHEVVFAGRLDALKGVPFLLRAWDAYRLRRPGSSLHLTIAGSGPLEDTVAGWAAERPSVTFTGRLPRDELLAVLGRARAVVVTTRSEETFGLVAVEAMAAGTAPLAPALGSFPEIVSSGHDGLLYPPGDPDALVAALAGVDDAPERWDGYGRAARSTWEERFRPGPVMDRLLEVYRFAIDHPPDHPVGRDGIDGAPGRSPWGRRSSRAPAAAPRRHEDTATIREEF
ncbi:MAG: hypothetical protein QG622_3061 [Actinomycetota bacterium]|nr:hypothetical protein [Actinomycetota bacterium]